MKNINKCLDDACSHIANSNELTDKNKEELIDLISEVQNKLDELELGE